MTDAGPSGRMRARVGTFRHHDSGHVVVGRGDRRPFAGESPVPDLERLARYRPAGAAPESAERGTWSDPFRRLLGMAPDPSGDGRFRTLRPDELSDVERVYVFVHGWVPGSRAVTEERLVSEGRVPLAWDERVVNVVGRSMVEAYEPLLAALSERDPEAAVLWYSWVDQSGTDIELFAARGSLRYTSVNGSRLAAALREAIGPGRPRIHLIGHSHGSVVAAHAAACLDPAPEHLTLLDCPEDWFSRAGGAAGLLGDVLPRVRPGRGAGSTFVDSYASMFGRAYHDEPGLGDVVDVRLAPVIKRSDPASAASQAHQFAVAWYAQSVSDPQATGGFAFSPLRGTDTRALGSYYAATARGRVVEVLRWRPDRVRPLEQSTTVLDHRVHQLDRRSPDLALLATMPPDAVLLEYDLSFTRPGRSTRVEVAVDGQLAAVCPAAHPLPERGRFVRVPPGRAKVQFRLVDPGFASSASVAGVRVVGGDEHRRNLDDAAAVRRVALISAAIGAASALAAVGAVAALASRARGSDQSVTSAR